MRSIQIFWIDLTFLELKKNPSLFLSFLWLVAHMSWMRRRRGRSAGEAGVVADGGGPYLLHAAAPRPCGSQGVPDEGLPGGPPITAAVNPASHPSAPRPPLPRVGGKLWGRVQGGGCI